MITGYIKQKIMTALDEVAITRSRKRQSFGRIWVGNPPKRPHSHLFAHNGILCGVNVVQDNITIDIPVSGYNYNFINRLFITISEYVIYCSYCGEMRQINEKLTSYKEEAIATHFEFDINSPAFDTVISDLAAKVVSWVEGWVK